MAFDFPAAPAVNDKYQPAAGPVYVWDGVAWVLAPNGGATLTDFVLKAGDTMGGALLLPSPDPVVALEAAHKRYVDTKLSDAPSDGTPYVRQDAAWISDPTATGAFLPLAGGVMTGGIDWSPGPTPTDPSTHLRLNKDPGYQMGINATSTGQLNYVIENAGNRHSFHVAGVEMVKISNLGPYAVNCRYRVQPAVNGAVFIVLDACHQNGTGAADQRAHPGGDNGAGGTWEWWRIGGGYGSNWSMKTTNEPEPGLRVNGTMLGSQMAVRSNASSRQDIPCDHAAFVRAFDVLKPTRYRLRDQVWPPTFEDGTPVENPQRVTRRDRFGFNADDPLLADVVETLDGEDRGIDIGQVLALAIAKIKQLEANLSTLQAKMKVITDLT